jgi:glucan phosphoethanolaminetransferase (alkaline phosphatase superfamily)
MADQLPRLRAALSGPTLYWLMVIVGLGSVALYADVALRPPKSTPAFRFVMVPVASWLLMIVVFSIVAFSSKQRP